MSKLSDLIAQLCPHGVEFLTLGEVCDYVDYRGKTPYKSDKGIFLVTAKNIRKGYIDYEKSIEYIPAENYKKVMQRGLPKIGDVLITTEAPCGNVAQVDRENIALAQRVIKYRPKDDKKLNSSFLKYMLLAKEFQDNLEKLSTGGTVKGIKGSILHKIKIPVPPLEIQKEIVRILDTFTELIEKLSEELSLRKKQYEFYREKLLTFGDEVEFKELANVSEIKRGVRVVRSQLTEAGKYPVYQNSMIPLGYYDKYNCHADTAFVISAGAAGEIGYSKNNFWAADDCLYINCNENLNSRFIYHVLLMKQPFILSNVRRASVPRLSRTVIENLKIPVPPLEVQKEIVRILDIFTELTEKLSEELTLRKKQYEFYRDKLLTFEEKI